MFLLHCKWLTPAHPKLRLPFEGLDWLLHIYQYPDLFVIYVSITQIQSVKLPVLVPAVLVPRYNFLYRYGYRKELYFKKYCIVPVPERLKAKVPEDFSYKILPVLRFFGEKRPFWPQKCLWMPWKHHLDVCVSFVFMQRRPHYSTLAWLSRKVPDCIVPVKILPVQVLYCTPVQFLGHVPVLYPGTF